MTANIAAMQHPLHFYQSFKSLPRFFISGNLVNSYLDACCHSKNWFCDKVDYFWSFVQGRNKNSINFLPNKATSYRTHFRSRVSSLVVNHWLVSEATLPFFQPRFTSLLRYISITPYHTSQHASHHNSHHILRRISRCISSQRCQAIRRQFLHRWT